MVTCRPERPNPAGGSGNLPPTLCVFVGHEFGVSGHGDDRRPYRRAWTCPRSILSLTTGMRFRAAIGTVLTGLAGTSSSPALRSEADRGPPFRSHAQNRAPSLIYPILAWPSFADDIFGPTNYS